MLKGNVRPNAHLRRAARSSLLFCRSVSLSGSVRDAANEAKPQKMFHHQDTKTPWGCGFLCLVSWCLGGSFAAAALAQRAVLPLVMRARPSYAAAAMRKTRRQKYNLAFVQ